MKMKKALCYLASVTLLGLVACQSKPPAEGGSVEAAAKQPSLLSKLERKSTFHLPAGTSLRVRLDQSLDTSRNRSGDTFTATLDAPVMQSEKIVIPKGTQFAGHVMSAAPSGRLKGRGYLTVTLDSFVLDGTTYEVSTSADSRVTGAHKKRNATLIGGGAGVGALVGGLTGGGKGAAIGAAAGAAAGTAGAAATGEKNVSLPAETVLQFALKAPVQVKG
jgi:outer membrane lipoprotein SlyB